MTVIFNCIANTSLDCVPKNKGEDFYHSTCFCLSSLLSISNLDLRDKKNFLRSPGSPIPISSRTCHKDATQLLVPEKNPTELKAQIEQNKSVLSKNDNVIKSIDLELCDNFKVPEEFRSARIFLEIVIYVILRFSQYISQIFPLQNHRIF